MIVETRLKGFGDLTMKISILIRITWFHMTYVSHYRSITESHNEFIILLKYLVHSVRVLHIFLK